MSVQPRSLLTADDVRSAGFRPDAGSETVDGRVAHVWYPSSRRGDRWAIGLGLYAAADVGDADRYWDGLAAELGGGDAGVERVAVGDQAIHAEGWLYVRHRGQVLWVAVEGPDPVLARWAVERLARAVCPRIPELPPAAAPPAAAPPDPPVLGADPVRSEPLPPREPEEVESPVLRPRATAPGRYRRRHLARAGLTVLDDRLVVVDARGRDHRFALDGTAGAPAAIGLTFDPRAAVTVGYLAVLDGEGRLLVRDGEPGAWATSDIRRFAEATGLRYLEPAARVDRIDWHRQPVEMEGTPWVFMLLVVLAVVGAPALAVAGVSALVVLAAGAAVGVLAWLATRGTHVHVTPPDP